MQSQFSVFTSIKVVTEWSNHFFKICSWLFYACSWLRTVKGHWPLLPSTFQWYLHGWGCGSYSNFMVCRVKEDVSYWSCVRKTCLKSRWWNEILSCMGKSFNAYQLMQESWHILMAHSIWFPAAYVIYLRHAYGKQQLMLQGNSQVQPY